MWRPGQSRLIRSALDFRKAFDRAKAGSGAVDFKWYPYDCFTNLYPIDRLLNGSSLVDLHG